jgi:PrtD family type I secretion system ABC transporter
MELPPALDPAVRACREHLRLAAGLSALVNILYLAPTIYMMQVYDRAVPTGGTVTLLWLTIVIAFALLTLSALDAVRARVLIRAGMRLDNELSETVLDRLLASPKDPRSLSAMREFDTLRQAVSGPPAMALFDIIWTPIYVVVACLVHPLIGLLSLFFCGLLFAITFANERQSRSTAKEAARAMSASYVAQERFAQQGELIRALGMRRATVIRQLNDRRRGLQLVTQQQLAGGQYTSIAKFVRLFAQSVALGLGAWLAIDQKISVGSIIAASVLLSRALQPIELIVGSWSSLIQARQSIGVLGDLLSPGLGDGRSERFDLPAPKGQLEVHGVGVLTPDGSERALLRNISFGCKAGDLIGVIGPSGAGKSTLARILGGGLQPDAGAVRIDGSDMRDWDPERLATSVGYLPQDSALLPGTIAQNISRFAFALGGEKAAIDSAVVKAAGVAGVHEMITALPGGYDRQLGWNGEGLSVGQQQRIALARACYDNPCLLVLDEPNSALDGEGDKALMRAIAIMRSRGSTIVLVAHRASTLADASHILLLVNGTVSLFGPRDDVMAQLERPTKKPELVPSEAA